MTNLYVHVIIDFIDKKRKKNMTTCRHQTMMKLELLPNEVLCLCFEFFDVIELFNAFDGLNQRFSRLIRQIPLYLNFKFVRKSIFDEFCARLSSDDQIRNQIYSLKLSNSRTFKEIELFLSKFTFDQFPRLQSFEFDTINEKNVEQLNTMLPSVPELHRLCLLTNELYLLENIPLSKLKVLYIDSIVNLCNLSSITHLSIRRCTFTDIGTDIFRYLPVLKYLRIEHILHFNHENEHIHSSTAIHLKRLIFDDVFVENFEQLIEIFCHTPNLTNLTIAHGFIKQMHVDKMQEIIESFLPLLKVFKFNFLTDISNRQEIGIRLFDSFQTDFWHQYQWFTEYVIQNNYIYIYTIPNPIDKYNISLFRDRYATNHINAFDNVRSLKINPGQNHAYEFYFAHIEELQLVNYDIKMRVLRNSDIERLKSMVNFAHIKHLQIHEIFSIENPSDWIELFHKMPKLCELTIPPNILRSFLEYSNDQIRILNIKYKCMPSTIVDHVETSKLRPMFSNLETYTGWLNSIDDLIYLMKNFANISMIYADIPLKQDTKTKIKQLERQLNESNATYHIEIIELNYNDCGINVRIWF